MIIVISGPLPVKLLPVATKATLKDKNEIDLFGTYVPKKSATTLLTLAHTFTTARLVILDDSEVTSVQMFLVPNIDRLWCF